MYAPCDCKHRRIYGYTFGEARQVVSKSGGPRTGMGSAEGLGALPAPIAGSGAEPQPKSNLVHFSLNI